MEKIDKKQQNLAGNEMKAKKKWKKPELKLMNFKYTGSGRTGPGGDFTATGNSGS